MNRPIAIIIITLVFLQKAPCQGIKWNKINHIPSTSLDLLSVDGRDHIFTADQQGNIHQYNSLGDSINSYSPVLRTKLTKLEAFWTTTIFAFSADQQHYELLDRFLNPIANNRFRNDQVGVLRHATLGNGNVIWMLNETRMSLIKWDLRRNQLLQEQPLSLILPASAIKVTDLTERKNLLFLQLEKTGIYIFDNQGNFIRHLSAIPDVTVFIYDEHLYYISNAMLYKTNFLSDKTTSVFLPDTVYKKVALTKQNLIFYGTNGIDIYTRPDGL